MSNHVENFKELKAKCKELYDVRDLLASIVISNANGSIVVYPQGNGAYRYVVCQGEKRLYCSIDNVFDEIQKLMQ